MFVREIKRAERITEEDRRRLDEEDRKNREYLKIKPDDTTMTVNDCTTFWSSLFIGEEA